MSIPPAVQIRRSIRPVHTGLVSQMRHAEDAFLSLRLHRPHVGARGASVVALGWNSTQGTQMIRPAAWWQTLLGISAFLVGA